MLVAGDIGLVHQDGSFSIIDRKKDLVKLQAGEYVSLVKVEMALSQSAYVENICVYADPNENFTLALVSPKASALRKLAGDLDLLKTVVQEAASSLAPEALGDQNAVGLAEHAIICRAPQVIAVDSVCH